MSEVTCRFCKELAWHQDVVKYGVRHYAHFDCYLKARKTLAGLSAHQISKFPYRLLLENDLLDEAKEGHPMRRDQYEEDLRKAGDLAASSWQWGGDVDEDGQEMQTHAKDEVLRQVQSRPVLAIYIYGELRRRDTREDHKVEYPENARGFLEALISVARLHPESELKMLGNTQ